MIPDELSSYNYRRVLVWSQKLTKVPCVPILMIGAPLDTQCGEVQLCIPHGTTEDQVIDLLDVVLTRLRQQKTTADDSHTAVMSVSVQALQ